MIDPDILERTGIVTSVASAQRLLQSLRLLDLVDDGGRPTDVFNGLAVAPEKELTDRFEEALRQAYAPIFQVAEPTDGYTRVRDAFRTNTPHSQQKRMVTLFLNLCEAAGMITEIPKASSPGPALVRTKPKSGAAAPSARKSRAKRTLPPASPSTEMWVTRFPTIAGIMKKLPADDGEWTKDNRDHWYRTLGTILDFDVDIVERRGGDESDQDEQNG